MSIHLGQALLIAIITAVVGLLVMESYQTTPWLANRLMRWSVRLRYTDNSERATIRGEELISLLEDLPTLFKLPTAVAFFLRALAYRLTGSRGYARSTLKPNALKSDVALLPAVYLFNFFHFSTWLHLGRMTTNPWVSYPWLCGLLGVLLLAWRNRAPIIAFAIQWMFAVAAWPFMSEYVPVVGIPVALYAVSFYRSRKTSLWALAASFFPAGLQAYAVAFNAPPHSYDLPIVPFTSNFFSLVVMAMGAWFFGYSRRVRQRRQQHLEHEQKLAQKNEVLAAERRRIDRELHDIFSNSPEISPETQAKIFALTRQSPQERSGLSGSGTPRNDESYGATKIRSGRRRGRRYSSN